MKIGVISDTHGNVTAFNKVMEFMADADLIVHAGDVLYHPPRLGFMEGYDIPAFAQTLNSLTIPIVIAQGNCDAQVYEELLEMPVQSPYAYVSSGGIRILINHGHLLTKDQMIGLGRKYKADYFISGHTHLPVLEDRGDMVLINPGSPSISKLEIDGKAIPSVGIITEDGTRIININDGTVILESQSQKV